ncbi:MAG TPA: serine hydrolase domain-containing protein [Acidimicrobiales bacterium]|jgi:CubicO group peptidase (beta-lactamase class C family)
MTPRGEKAVPIGGSVDPAFTAVQAAFAENFSSRGELGAGVCVVVDGRTVVDLWGGWRDGQRQHPWQRDTLVNVFSIGKAVAAVCVARLVGQGALAFDDPVARYWPEFGRQGKSSITIRQLLSHQAGLPAVRAVLPPRTVFDWEAMCAALAAQSPWWEPGTAHGYHVNTFGFLVGELVRRATGRTLGTMVRQEITGPLGSDFFVGLPAADLSRVAEFVGLADAPTRRDDELGDEAVMELHAYFNPPELSGSGVVNTVEWRQAELPSTNGHATARGIARLFEALVAGGTYGGCEIVASGSLTEAVTETVYGDDLILHRPSRFGVGFQLTQAERPLGPNRGSFGHFGAGGSLGFCDPEAKLALGYAMNMMGPRWQNPRNQALVAACYSSLAG